MTPVFCFCSFISLRSFCALRQAPNRALYGYVSFPWLGIGYITPPCVLFSKSWLITSVSTPPRVYSSLCLLNNQFILFPTAIQSLVINYFHILNLIFKSVLEVHEEMLR